mgnify:CR=1 FL=1
MFTGKHKIRKVKFLKTSQDPAVAYAKQSLVDVLCSDQLGRQYIVEMQVAKTIGFEKRAQYYAAKAYSQQLESGEKYHQLKEIIFLAITDFVMFPNKKAYKSDHVILDRDSHQHDLKDFSFTFLELPKFHKTIDQLSTLTDKWAYFFKHADQIQENEVSKIIGSDKVLLRVFEELNRFSWGPIELNTYEENEKRERDAQAIILAAQVEGQEKGLAEGREKGLAEGENHGEKTKALKIAKTMKQNGYATEVIIALTELSQEDIENI